MHRSCRDDDDDDDIDLSSLFTCLSNNLRANYRNSTKYVRYK